MDPVEIDINLNQNVDEEATKASNGLGEFSSASQKARKQLESDIAAQKKLVDDLQVKLINLQKQQAKRVSTNDAKEIAEKQKLGKEIDAVTKELQEQTAAYSQLQTARTKASTTSSSTAYDPAAQAKGFQNLSFSMQQVARELPTLAISPQTFIMAISNNLPMLQDQITKTTAMNKELKASGLATVPVWQQLAKSLFSPQTALVALITIGTLYGKKIGQWISSTLKFGDAAELTASQVDDLKKSISETIGSEIGKLDALFYQLEKTTEGTKENFDLKNKIIDQYGDYLAGADAEITSLENTAGAYDLLTAAIKRKTEAQIFEKSIVNLRTELQEDTQDGLFDLDEALQEEFGAEKGAEYLVRIRASLEGGLKRDEFDDDLKEAIIAAEAEEYIVDQSTRQAVGFAGTKLRDTIDDIAEAWDDYDSKIESTKRVLGTIFDDTDGNSVVSAIEKAEAQLDQAKLMPETTEEEVAARVKAIAEAEELIKKLKQEDKTSGSGLDTDYAKAKAEITTLRNELNGLSADESSRAKLLADQITKLEQFVALREKQAEVELKLSRAGEDISKVKTLSAIGIDGIDTSGQLPSSLQISTPIIDWEQVFGTLQTVSTSALKDLQKQIRYYITTADDSITPADFKSMVDALDEAARELADRNPIASLFTSMQELSGIDSQLSASKDLLETYQEQGASIELIKNQMLLISKLEGERAKKAEDVNNSFASTAQRMQDVSGMADDISSILTDLGVEVPDSVGTAIAGVSQVAEGLGSVDITKPFSVITGGVKALSGVVKSVTSLFGSSTDSIEEQTEKYNALVNALDDVIERQQELFDSMSGSNAVDAYEDIVATQERIQEAARQMGKDYLNSGASYKDHSEGYNQLQDLKKYREELTSIGVDLDSLGGRVTGLFDLDIEQLEALKYETPEVFAALDDEVQDYITTIIDSGDAIDELGDSLKELQTGFSLDEARGELNDFLLDAETTWEDVAQSLEDNMNQAILNIVNGKFDEKIAAWYDKYAEAMSDGELTEAEKQQLQDEYKEIYEEMQNELSNAQDAAGIDPDSADREATSTGIAQASQDSVDELNGRMTAIQALVGEIRNHNASLVSSVDDATVFRNAIMSQLEDIANNTSYCKELTSIKNTLSSMQTNGIKVK